MGCGREESASGADLARENCAGAPCSVVMSRTMRRLVRKHPWAGCQRGDFSKGFVEQPSDAPCSRVSAAGTPPAAPSRPPAPAGPASAAPCCAAAPSFLPISSSPLKPLAPSPVSIPATAEHAVGPSSCRNRSTCLWEGRRASQQAAAEQHQTHEKQRSKTGVRVSGEGTPRQPSPAVRVRTGGTGTTCLQQQGPLRWTE